MAGKKLTETEVQQFANSAAQYVSDSHQRGRGVHIPSYRKEGGRNRHRLGMGAWTAGTAALGNSRMRGHSPLLQTRWTDPSPATRQNLPEAGTVGPREVSFTASIAGVSCSITVAPELRRWAARPSMLTPPAEEFLQSIDASGVGDYYVGKTEGQARTNAALPWLSRAMQSIRARMQQPDQQALIKACKPTPATPVRLRLSYARIASEEGVAAMEARAIELKRRKDGSQNTSGGLASAGGEGWLYFWNVIDTRFQ